MTTPSWEIPTYVRGVPATSTVTFTADPTTITATVNPPGKASTSYVYGSSIIVRSALGVYTLQIDTTPAVGNWTVRWVGTGAVVYAWEDLFIVYSSATTP